MKIKRFFYALLIVFFATTMIACGDNSGEQVQPSDTLQICVGSESVWYYQDMLNQYVKDNNLPFKIKVTGVDTGKYADNFLLDTSRGADIFVAAHDNLGKLLAGSGTIAAITDEDLIDNIMETNSRTFQNVIYMGAGGGQPQYYGVPIIKQALVLFYNKDYLSADDVKSWESILEVAKKENKLATTYIGSDGFNYSHWLLAQPESSDAITVFGEKGTLQLYKGGLWAGNMAWGDDQVAITKYAQRFTNDANGRGGAVVDDDTYTSELKNNQVLTVVAGAWNYGTIAEAWSNYGVALLPTFTLTEEDEYGEAKAGMVFRSGSFYDVKCLMKKKGSAFANYLDDIMLFLSSDKVQEGSYIYCNNLPASENVSLEYDEAYIEENYDIDSVTYYYDLAKAQIDQGEAAGIPQPFGYNQDYNPAYYSESNGYYIELHQNKNNVFGNDEDILKQLQTISYVWAHNKKPSPEELAAWLASL